MRLRGCGGGGGDESFYDPVAVTVHFQYSEIVLIHLLFSLILITVKSTLLKYEETMKINHISLQRAKSSTLAIQHYDEKKKKSKHNTSVRVFFLRYC